MAAKEFTTVSIPKPLFEKTKKAISGTGFTSVSDFATFLLRGIVVEIARNRKKGCNNSRLLKQLKDLGYL